MRSILSVTVLFLACAAPRLLNGQALGSVSQANASPAAVNLLPLQSVTLNAAAEWFAGSQYLTGTATLKANMDGSSTEQFSLGAASRTVTQGKADASKTCQWTDATGKAHDIGIANCFVALPWFAPQLFAQTGLSLSALTSVLDDGTVVRDGVSFHQLRYELLLEGLDAKHTASLREASTVKVLFDLKTVLPSRLEYVIHPDNNELQDLPVAVTFSDYRLISGLMLPFHIEKSVNGSVQVKLDVSTATAQ